MLFLVALCTATLSAEADDIGPKGLFVHHRSEGDVGQRDQYLWRLLGAALEHSRARNGDFALREGPVMEQARRIYSLTHDDGTITVSVFPIESGFGRMMTPVRIPVDRGLLGFRVLMIRADDQPRFAAIAGLAGLAAMRFCSMASWIDTVVMRNAGLTVIDSSSYAGMFRMLAAGRCDAINRSAAEITQEYELRRQETPGLAIEQHLALYYPMPAYFWFSHSAYGQKRAERVEFGLRAMLADGSFQRLFDDEFAGAMASLAMDRRRVIALFNPALGPDEPLSDPSLWLRLPAAPR